MGMRMVLGVAFVVTSWMCTIPSAWAAESHTAEAAEAPTTEAAAIEQIQSAIDSETDPELRQVMEEQLQLLESGQLNFNELHTETDTALGAPSVDGVVGADGLAGRLPGVGPIGPPVDGQTEMPRYMTPELQGQLGSVFDRVGTGELTEQEARTQAEAILKEHGVDPREIGPAHEGDWEHEEGQWQGDRSEGFERAYLEQMSPEAREQMEQFFSEHEAGEQPTMDRETFEREVGTFEATTHEYEAVTQEYEAPTHEYETPQFEQPANETPPAPEYDYQPPQQP